MNEVLRRETNVVRLWNGILLDLNKVVGIEPPQINTANSGYMSEAKLSFGIKILDGEPWKILEDIDSSGSDDCLWKGIQSPKSNDPRSRIIVWLMEDGSYKELNHYDCKKTQTKAYIDFKIKWQILVDEWSQGKVKELDYES